MADQEATPGGLWDECATHAVSHLAVEADGYVLPPGAVWHGAAVLAGSGGAATVDFYDGHDTGDDWFDALTPAQSKVARHYLHPGLVLRRGLYVDIGSNVDKCTVYYRPPTGDRR